MSPLTTDGGLTAGSHRMTWLFSNEEFSAAHVYAQPKDGEAERNAGH